MKMQQGRETDTFKEEGNINTYSTEYEIYKGKKPKPHNMRY
jgi:hypothetical protein